MAKRPKQIVGNAGMFYVCYQLSLLNWNVMPTSRNARGVDIIAFSMKGTKMLTFQIKTLSKRNPIAIGSSLDIMGDFWIVVVLKYEQPRCCILLPHEIRALASHVTTKNYGEYYFVDPKYYMVEGFIEKWDRIGTGD